MKTKLTFEQIKLLLLLMLNFFNLGPIQRRWLLSLILHPERQAKRQLGYKTKDGYRACCLGEAGLIAGVCEFDNLGQMMNTSFNPSPSYSYPYVGYEKIGLYGHNGRAYPYGLSLADMNDDGKTWPQIAGVILKDIRVYLKERK